MLDNGLLLLPLYKEALYSTMIAILNAHGSGHLYVEHAVRECTWECVEHPTPPDLVSNSKEEEEVMEVDYLSDDDDEEVVAARMKKAFLANKRTTI